MNYQPKQHSKADSPGGDLCIVLQICGHIGKNMKTRSLSKFRVIDCSLVVRACGGLKSWPAALSSPILIRESFSLARASPRSAQDFSFQVWPSTCPAQRSLSFSQMHRLFIFCSCCPDFTRLLQPSLGFSWKVFCFPCVLLIA